MIVKMCLGTHQKKASVIMSSVILAKWSQYDKYKYKYKYTHQKKASVNMSVTLAKWSGARFSRPPVRASSS